jgi:hypothetical protein
MEKRIPFMNRSGTGRSRSVEAMDAEGEVELQCFSKCEDTRSACI